MTCSALPPAGNGIQSVPVGGGRRGRRGRKRGTLGHLGLSTEQRAGLRAQCDPKRLLTHIWCHGWHFTSLACLTFMYNVCNVLCSLSVLTAGSIGIYSLILLYFWAEC